MKISRIIPQTFDQSPYRNLLNKKMNSEISEGEFDFEVSSGAYSCREEYRYLELPDMPADLREFREKWKHKYGSAKDKLRERIMSSRIVKTFMDEYYGLVAKNMANAYWLEHHTIVQLSNLAYPIAEGFRAIYLDYPKDIRYVDDSVVWVKKSGSWWSKQVDEYRGRIGYGDDEGSGSSEIEGAGGGVQPAVRQDDGEGQADSEPSVSEAVPF